MKITYLLLAALLATAPAYSAVQVDPAPERRRCKAEEILLSTEVVSSNGVGFGFEPPEANWAISVIVKYDPNPIERLKRIAKDGTVEGGVMSLLAIKAVDKVVFAKLADE